MAAASSAAAAAPRLEYVMGELGNQHLSGLKLGEMVATAESVNLGYPEWEAALPLLKTLGGDLTTASSVVALAQAERLREKAAEASPAAVIALLRKVLTAKSPTLLKLAAALVRRAGVDSLPRDVVDLAGAHPGICAALDDESRAALMRRSPEAFDAYFRDQLARFVEGGMPTVATLCVLSELPLRKPQDKVRRVAAKLAQACEAAGVASAERGLSMLVDMHARSGFRALSAVRAAIGARLAVKAMGLDPVGALCRACSAIVEAGTLTPESLGAMLKALDALVTSAEQARARFADEAAVRARSGAARRGGEARTLSQAIDTACDAVVRLDPKGALQSPVVELWPHLASGYLQKVHHPMDFGTIRRRARSYAAAGDAARDAKQVLSNCEIFNGPTHAVTSQARRCVDAFVGALERGVAQLREFQARAAAERSAGLSSAADGTLAGREASALVHARCVLSDPCLARVVLTQASEAVSAGAKRGSLPAQNTRMRGLAQAVAAVCSGTVVAPKQVGASSGAQAAPLEVWAALTWGGAAEASAETARVAREAAAAVALGGEPSASSSDAGPDPDGLAAKAKLAKLVADAKARLSHAASRAAASAEGAGLMSAAANRWTMITCRSEIRRAALACVPSAEGALAVLPFVVSSVTQAHADACQADKRSATLPASSTSTIAAAAAAAAAASRDPLAEADADVSDAAFLVDIWFPRVLDRLTTVPPLAASAGSHGRQLVVPDHVIALCHERVANFVSVLHSLEAASPEALRERASRFLELFVKAASSASWGDGERLKTPVTEDIVACAAQAAYDSPLMASARQVYDRLCPALGLDMVPLGLRNPSG